MSEELLISVNNIVKNLVPNDFDYVIYHNPCVDGTAAAMIAWHYMRTNFPDREIVFYPTNYGRLPPDVTGRNVIILDFSFKKPDLDVMISQANKLLIIDHHKTAQEDLKEVPDEHKIFDMSRSGAYLTWQWFYPDEDVPLFIQYVSDRDIWTKQMEFGDEFAAWSHTLPMEMEVYEEYLDNDKLNFMIETKGKPFLELTEYQIDQVCPKATVKFMEHRGMFFFVAYLNTTVHRSDIGNKIFQWCKWADFSATYAINDRWNSTGFSLRSEDCRMDVSAVAKKFGGGGHRNAAGMGVNLVTNVLPCTCYDSSGRLYAQLPNIYFGKFVVDDQEFSVVYLNSSVYRTKLGTYLVQTQYVEEDRRVQSCISIFEKTGKCDREWMPDQADIAAVWSYDGNTTEFSIVYDKKLAKESVELLDKTLQREPNEGVKYVGMCHELDLNAERVTE